MAVAGACGKADARAGPDGLSACVHHEYELALEHGYEFVLLRMRVTGRRLPAGKTRVRLTPYFLSRAWSPRHRL
jgi:hypothetical protein